MSDGALPSVELFSCRIHNLNLRETVEAVEKMIQSKKSHRHVVVNVDKLIQAGRNPSLCDYINSCDLVNADGMPVVWASRLLQKPLKERVAGIDLFEKRAHETRVILRGHRCD